MIAAIVWYGFLALVAGVGLALTFFAAWIVAGERGI